MRTNRVGNYENLVRHYLIEHNQQIVQFAMQIPTNGHLLGDSSRHHPKVRHLFERLGCLAQYQAHILWMQTVALQR